MESTNTTTWGIDNNHSTLQFSVRHMLITNVKGTFTAYTGTVSSNGTDFNGAHVEVHIPVSSISTGQADRDNHLKSPDFFSAEQYPDITIKSTSFKSLGNDKFEMVADVTIRDVTKPVTFEVEKTGDVEKDPYGLQRAGFELHGAIDRNDYNLSWNAALETGGAVVGPKVKLSADIQLIKQN